MPNRENVINELRFQLNSKEVKEQHYPIQLSVREAKKILALLNENEPILLKNQHKPYGFSTNANSPWISRCPRCGKKVEGKQTRFCKYCGQEVKWDGFDRKTLV